MINNIGEVDCSACNAYQVNKVAPACPKHKEGVCECGAELPTKKREVRQRGYFEYVTECKMCGATYIN